MFWTSPSPWLPAQDRDKVEPTRPVKLDSVVAKKEQVKDETGVCPGEVKEGELAVVTVIKVDGTSNTQLYHRAHLYGKSHLSLLRDYCEGFG